MHAWPKTSHSLPLRITAIFDIVHRPSSAGFPSFSSSLVEKKLDAQSTISPRRLYAWPGIISAYTELGMDKPEGVRTSDEILHMANLEFSTAIGPAIFSTGAKYLAASIAAEKEIY